MRQVAVTEGDKVEAQIRLGVSVNGYGVGDLAEAIVGVARRTWTSCRRATRTNTTSPRRSVGEASAASPCATRRGSRPGCARFLDAGGFGAFTDTFEDLDGLAQLPGIGVQRLMADGYGFGAEGDWKTAALVRIAKVMGAGLDGGTSFMEDYTYDLAPGGPAVLGAHMLEVCPSIAADGRRARSTRSRSAARPIRCGSSSRPRPGRPCTSALARSRRPFPAGLNEVELVEPPEDLPRLPVARALWRPKPDFATAAEAWLARAARTTPSLPRDRHGGRSRTSRRSPGSSWS